MKKLKVQVYASEKVRPAFAILARQESVAVSFTDFSLSPSRFCRNLKKMRHADLVYFHSPTNLRIVMMPFARLFKKPVLLQWIGTDVITATWKNRPPFYDPGLEKTIPIEDSLTEGLFGFPKAMVQLTLRFHRAFLSFLKAHVTRHIACAPKLSKDLKTVGIAADTVPVLNHVSPALLPLPEKPALLSYIGFQASSDKRNFYGWQSLLRLAGDFPQITFYVIGRGPSMDAVAPNLVFLGYVDDIERVLAKVTGLLRITYDDGMPRLVMEALAKGRYVIFTGDFPCTAKVTTYEEIREAVRDIIGRTRPNAQGMRFVRDHYNAREVARQFTLQFKRAARNAA